MEDNWQAKLAEYDALPDDLTTCILWTDQNPSPKLPIVCRECGAVYRHFQTTWDDVRTSLRLHGAVPSEIRGYCPRHSPEADHDEETEEEE